MKKASGKVYKINDNISLLNVDINVEDEIVLMELLQPINELVCSNPKNYIYIYQSSSLWHAEAFVLIGEKFASAHSVGVTLNSVVKKLIPTLIVSTNSSNLLPRNKQLSMEASYENSSK